MEQRNIVVVRVTNVIPFNGVVKTISNSQYIKKETGTIFSNKMSNLLKKLKIIPPIDWKIITDEDKLKEKAQVDAKILEEYLPYTSDYNSCLLFSLNGVVPDDNEISYGTNFFSNKKCAVIELLEEHIKNVVSLTPIDTLIKGDVPLSKKAIILIEEETYQKLPPLEKRTIRKP